MQIKFLGAAGTVTGSCYHLTSESGQSILIDCGMFQGVEEIEHLNYPPLACDCSSISGAVLTHAHLDHCGRLPTLQAQGFGQQIWMTLPTRDISEISLFDSARVMQEESKKTPLYDKEEVKAIIEQFRTVEYERPFSIGSFTITLRDAGHILGSTSIEIIDQSATGQARKIVFSGDLGNSPEDLIKATELIDSADAVVMESTYGDRLHPVQNPSEVISAEINAVETSKAVLLIPAFSIERTQELLHRINHLKKEGKVKKETPVFLDSPMGEKTTEVFERYRGYYNEELTTDFQSGDPFDFPGLTVIENRNDSKILKKLTGPKVIIAGSGMMTGGRILGHARDYLPLDSTRLLIVGYQAVGTLGRTILDGEKDVVIEGMKIRVNASVSDNQAMSSHADQGQLMRWLGSIHGVKKVYLTHGENGPRTILAQKIKTDLGMEQVVLPILNQVIEI